MKNKDTKKWLETRAFYAVVASLLVVIFGVSVAIINVAKIRRAADRIGGEDTTFYSVTEFTEMTTDSQANLNATGIADERETVPETTSATTKEQKKYILPINSNVIKDYSGNDMVYSKTMDDWRVHSGVDVGGEQGGSVVAIQDGVVLDVYSDELWGDVVIIQHGGGIEAKYCGVKSAIKKGASVKQGQEIGKLGVIPAESKDGFHVHLELCVNENIADPIQSMNMLSADGPVE